MKFKDIEVGATYFYDEYNVGKEVTQELLDTDTTDLPSWHRAKSLKYARITVLSPDGFYQVGMTRVEWNQNKVNINGEIDGRYNQAVHVQFGDGTKGYARVRKIIGLWDEVIPRLIEESKVRADEATIQRQKITERRKYIDEIRTPSTQRILDKINDLKGDEGGECAKLEDFDKLSDEAIERIKILVQGEQYW